MCVLCRRHRENGKSKINANLTDLLLEEIMIKTADVVCGLAWGDEAKGKITAWLAKNNDYDYVCRWSGGCNAGHTVYVNQKKYKTHLVPSGVFFGIKSIIGPGCVVDQAKLMSELEYLRKNGFNTDVVKISPRAHIITRHHLHIDSSSLAEKLGTTKSGIAPCYSDKAFRSGIQAKEVFPEEMLWDEELTGNILCEGAQGIWLDLDIGNYPYVTSSTTLPYAACSLGFPPQKIKNIYGAAKIYDTRSGTDPDFPDSLLENTELLKIADLGEEYGVTTGRRRKVNWLDLKRLVKAINLTGTTHVIISKCDILESAGMFVLFDSEKKKFKNLHEMTNYVQNEIKINCPLVEDIKFSFNPMSI